MARLHILKVFVGESDAVGSALLAPQVAALTAARQVYVFGAGSCTALASFFTHYLQLLLRTSRFPQLHYRLIARTLAGVRGHHGVQPQSPRGRDERGVKHAARQPEAQQTNPQRRRCRDPHEPPPDQ